MWGSATTCVGVQHANIRALERERKKYYTLMNAHAMFNCSDLDSALRDAHFSLSEGKEVFALALVALVSTSLLLLIQGEHLARPLGAVVGACAAGGGVYVVTSFAEAQSACTVRLGASGVAAVVGATIAAWAFKAGLFALGAAGFGAVAHLLYETLPTNEWLPPSEFALFGRSAYYYAVLLVAGLVGAVAAGSERKLFVRLCSSLLGGSGLALAIHLASAQSGDTVDAPVLLLLTAGSGGAGVVAQSRIEHHRKRRKEKAGERAA